MSWLWQPLPLAQGDAGTLFTQGTDDTLALAETLTRQLNRALADAVGLTESLPRQAARLLEEALGLSEALARQVGKALGETVDLDELLAGFKIGDFPTVVDAEPSQELAATTSATVNLAISGAAGAGAMVGDLLIVGHRAAAAGALGWPAGWNVLAADNTADASDDVTGIRYRLDDGALGSSIQITQGSGRSASVCYRIRGHADPAVQPPEISTAATGNSNTPNPTNLAMTGGAKNFLMLWMAGMESPGSGGTPPADYSLTVEGASLGSGAAGCNFMSRRRFLNAASEDPAGWLRTNSTPWTAWVIAVHPFAASVQTPKAVDDTVAFTEQLARETRRTLTETLALTETLTPQTRKAILETVALTETLVRQTLKPQLEALGLTENLTAVRLVVRELADTVALTEELSRRVGRPLAETVSLIEQAARQTGKRLTETVSLTENLSAIRLVVKPLADTVVLTEELRRLILRASDLAESVGLAEALARRTGRTVAETLSLAENLGAVKATTKTVGDVLALSETVRRLTGRVLEETVGLSEEQQAQVRKTLAETVAFTEQLVISVIRPPQSVGDTVVLTEAQQVEVGRALQETLGLTETRLVAIARTVTEEIALSEFLGTLLQGPSAADTILLIFFHAESVDAPELLAERFDMPELRHDAEFSRPELLDATFQVGGNL